MYAMCHIRRRIHAAAVECMHVRLSGKLGEHILLREYILVKVHILVREHVLI